MAIDQQRSVLPLLSNRTDHPYGTPLARGAMALPAVARPAVPLRAAFSLLLLAFLFSLAFSASAGIKQCERLTPEQQMQADFCEARLACRVAIDLLATCADATAALRTFHDTLNAPNAGRPELDEADAQGSEARHALPTHAPNVEGKLREERALIEADERELATAMHTAHCSKVEVADLAQCEQLEKKALNLQRRLDQFERDSASLRAAGEPPAMLPVQSSTPMRSDDQRAIIFVDTDRASAASPATEHAVASTRPSLPAPSALAPRAVDTLFKEAISSADAEAKERAQREANKRVAAAAAAENTALANAQRTAQEQADAQSMLTGSVGEVFALADRLEAEKQFNAARKAFRTLIARFPDHALAAAAVARLSAASTTSAALSGNLVQPGTADVTAHGTAQGGAQGRAAGPTSAGSPDACDAQVAEFEAEVTRLKERKPANASSIAMLQTVMYMASKSLSLGQGVCSGNHREDELTNGIQATFDGARRACANISASANECVARAPTW